VHGACFLDHQLHRGRRDVHDGAEGEVRAGVEVDDARRGDPPWVEPRDIADAVAWLVSDEARYVSGVALPVDGGVTWPFKAPHLAASE
jgi:NAD(P)-dependent dehydrogenase (short-subunit alcohol dehydrogenase family)